MMIRKTETAEGVTLTVEGEAELKDAAPLRDALVDALARRKAVVVNAGRLERPDFALLQLLSSARISFSGQKISFAIEPGAGRPFARAWQEAGLPIPENWP